MFSSYNDRVRQEFKYDKIKENSILITFLSPTEEMISKLNNDYNRYKNYKSYNGNAQIINQSSIVFLLEYKNNICLFSGDAYMTDIIEKISFCDKINSLKIAHHGSYRNNSIIKDFIAKYEVDKLIITCSDKEKDSIENTIAQLNNLDKKPIIYSKNKISSYKGKQSEDIEICVKKMIIDDINKNVVKIENFNIQSTGL